MGNYRFRLSDMMPNAWFYKLKDLGRSRNHTNSKHPIKKKHISSTQTQLQPNHSRISRHRHSYYFSSEPFKPDHRLYDTPINSKASDVHFPDPPRKSSRRRSKRRTISASSKLVSSSVPAGCSCRANIDSVWTKNDSTPDYSASPDDTSPDPEFHGSLLPEFGSERTAELFEGLAASWSSSCSCRVSSSATDIIIDMDSKKCSAAGKFDKLDGFDSIPEIELPPILTKPAKFNHMISDIKNRDAEPTRSRKNSVHGLSVKAVKEESVKTVKEQRTSQPIRRSSATSPGLKLRANSPRIASKKIQAYSRKSLSARRKNLSDSFAVVKSSFDPQRDFRDSMVEMILENDIRASKDLEELLACYLSLNSNEYHDLIVKVFEQIWFDLTDIRL